MTLFTELVEGGELVAEAERSCLLDGRGDTYVEPCGSKSMELYCFFYSKDHKNSGLPYIIMILMATHCSACSKQLHCFSCSKDHKNTGLPYIIMILDHNSGLPSIIIMICFEIIIIQGHPRLL